MPSKKCKYRRQLNAGNEKQKKTASICDMIEGIHRQDKRKRMVRYMSIMEAQSLDMAAILMHAYDVGDLINRSQEAADFLYWKRIMEQDEQAQRFIRELAKTKELFDETQRFGHYHPNYHEALEKVRAAEQKLNSIPSVARFKEAEERLDELLFTVSETVARSVSESIKVPSNKLEPSGHGCSSGGSCSGKCG